MVLGNSNSGDTSAVLLIPMVIPRNGFSNKKSLRKSMHGTLEKCAVLLYNSYCKEEGKWGEFSLERTFS